MIWFAFVLGAVALIALVVKGIADDSETKFGAGVVTVIGAILFLVFGTISCFEKVDFGTVKVGTLFGAVKETTLEEGINFPVNPFMDWTVYNVQLTTVEYTGDYSLECLSQDDKEYWMEASISYRLLPQNVYWTKQNIKDLESLITEGSILCQSGYHAKCA
jgi:regulator of protease activity HflC (stomatin/prohibitin superfamily)